MDTRRRGLEDYMEKGMDYAMILFGPLLMCLVVQVCGIKVIFESDLIQDFLCVPQLGSQVQNFNFISLITCEHDI